MGRPTPPGGFGTQGNDFTYMRKVEGHIVQCNDGDDGTGTLSVDNMQNAATYNDIFGED